MPAPNAPLIGDQPLAAVTEAMVAFHERYYHRKPVTAKTPLLGDEMLVCVLGGVYTDVEKTMIELQTHHDRPVTPQRLPERHATQSSSPQSSAYQAATSSSSSQTTTSAPTSKSNYSSSPPRTQPNRTSSDPRGC